jgi:hypothetical protein
MLHGTLADDLREDELTPRFVSPAWADCCFANVPDTVSSLFGTDAARPLPETVFEGVSTDVDHVVLAFVDGFGWNHFQRVRDDHSFLTRLAERATVTPLTAGYPSETAAAVSTIHTGRQPAEHGVLGWNAYVEDLGGCVQTLPFADRDRTPLGEVRDDPDPAALIDERTLYERLDADSVLVQPEEIGGNPYDGQVTRGAEPVGYDDATQAAYRVRDRLDGASEPTYCYCYLPNVDAAAHEFGVAHEETDAQLGAVCRAIEREIVDGIDPDLAERTLLIVTADHGEVDATPETTVDLDGLDLEPHLRRDGAGEPIPALGGPRNLQFHARDGHRDALRAELEHGLAPLEPLVLDRERIIAAGLFGDREPSGAQSVRESQSDSRRPSAARNPSEDTSDDRTGEARESTERFRERCPDLLAVPREGFAWYDDGHLAKVGMHGGLHPDEMLVPFAAARIDTLQR